MPSAAIALPSPEIGVMLGSVLCWAHQWTNQRFALSIITSREWQARSSPHQDERPEWRDQSHCCPLASVYPSLILVRGFVDGLFRGTLDPSEHEDLGDLDRVSGCRRMWWIDREGAMVQYVPLDRRAWHAGVSVYDGRERCNDFSVGIELIGTDKLGVY